MRTRDGIELSGPAARDIVAELRLKSFVQASTAAEFRAQMAARAEAYYGRRVRCDTDDNFVADLLDVGELLEE